MRFLRFVLLAMVTLMSCSTTIHTVVPPPPRVAEMPPILREMQMHRHHVNELRFNHNLDCRQIDAGIVMIQSYMLELMINGEASEKVDAAANAVVKLRRLRKGRCLNL